MTYKLYLHIRPILSASLQNGPLRCVNVCDKYLQNTKERVNMNTELANNPRNTKRTFYEAENHLKQTASCSLYYNNHLVNHPVNMLVKGTGSCLF